ncbi:MAG: peptide deformylase [Parvularculales bacterium]
MAIREILVAPDPRLRQVSTPVETVDDDIRSLMDDMVETMNHADGVGLTAIQINVPKRIVVMNMAYGEPLDEAEADKSTEEEDFRDRPRSEPEPHFFINPEILDISPEMSIRKEGCLSVPGVYEEIERHATCRVQYLDREGTSQEMECQGLMSVCMQHEVDHMNGVLFVDHLSRLKRDMILKRLAKEKRQNDSDNNAVQA